MNQEERKSAEHYRNCLETHGPTHRALDWGSREGQELRFRVLAGIGDLTDARILDVGCGLGDFAAWMDANGIRADYTGIDLTPELIAEATRRHPGRRFLAGGILDPDLLPEERYDYVLASGIFATYPAGGAVFLRQAVRRMWGLCRRGCAFNSLSAWAPAREAGEFHADPLETLADCRELTPWLALRHDYHPRDFTVYLRREART